MIPNNIYIHTLMHVIYRVGKTQACVLNKTDHAKYVFLYK